MEELKQYAVIVEKGARALAESVNAAMRDKWLPIGGVAIGPASYAQAMVMPHRMSDAWDAVLEQERIAKAAKAVAAELKAEPAGAMADDIRDN